ncbi:alpha/beta hydrolase [Humitalea sp. 24SJ18S-53]|uniref:alpha/beta hydrolase n=1 Tax=Humitalea sp. 24SJ18S-53 TaxID=3422307 RepID=UPI003D67F377
MTVRRVFFATSRFYDDSKIAFGDLAAAPAGRLWAGVVACEADADPSVEPIAGMPEVARKDDPDAGLDQVLRDWFAIAAKVGGLPLLFVHGFNYHFADAVARTAALCEWLEADGSPPLVPLSFSWPSNGKGSLEAYRDDQNDSVGAGLALVRLLLAIDRLHADSRPVYMAHSMGARATRGAMQALAGQVDRPPIGLFRQAIIMAGDDVADVLDLPGRTASPTCGTLRPLADLADWVTIAVNRDDGTVWLVSGIVNSGDRIGTAGPAHPADLPPNVKVVDYSEVIGGIDVKPMPPNSVELNWIGHQYFRNDPRVRQDLVALLKEDTAPENVSGRGWGVPGPFAITEYKWRLYPR